MIFVGKKIINLEKIYNMIMKINDFLNFVFISAQTNSYKNHS